MTFNELISLETEDFTETIYKNVSDYLKNKENKNHNLKMVNLELRHSIDEVIEDYYKDTEYVFIPNSKGLFRYIISEPSTVNLDISSILSDEKQELENDMSEYMKEIKQILPLSKPNEDPYYQKQLEDFDFMTKKTDHKISINTLKEHKFKSERVRFDEFKDFIIKNKINKQYVRFLDNKIFLFKRTSSHFYNLDVLHYLKDNYTEEETHTLFKRWNKLEGDFRKYSFRNFYIQ